MNLAYFRSLAARFFRRSQTENELEEELRGHIQLRADDLERSGLGRTEAQRRARLEFGGHERFKEECRETIAGNFLDILMQDLRFSVRTLAKQPVFAVVAIVTLAIGIGMTTAMLSIVHDVLIRPLPYAHPDRLYAIWASSESTGQSKVAASGPDLIDYLEQNRSFANLAGYIPLFTFTWTGDGELKLVNCTSVSEQFFPIFGIKPYLGRLYEPREYTYLENDTLVVSYRFWKNQLGGDPNVIGRVVHFEGVSETIIGVLPPMSDLFPNTDVWPKHTVRPSWPYMQWRGNKFLRVVGELRPGVTPTMAQEDLTATLRRVPEEPRDVRVELVPLKEDLVGNLRIPLIATLGGVALMLVVASINVAALLLARAVKRQPEMALRLSLGAGRGRIARQLVTEATVLSIAGCALGLLLAWGTIRILTQLPSLRLPRLDEVHLNTPALIATIMIGSAVTLLFGWLPAIGFSRLQLSSALRSRATETGERRKLALPSLVVAEIACSVVLTVTAGLLFHSFWRVVHSDPGFQPQSLLRIYLRTNFYSEEGRPFWKGVLAQSASLSGVRSSALSDWRPGRDAATATFVFDDRPTDATQLPAGEGSWVSADFFRTVGTAMIAGRSFSEHDDQNAPAVVIVNAEAAHRFWPGQDPIGKRIGIKYTGPGRRSESAPRMRELVGIVGNMKQDSLEASPAPAVYLSYLQDETNHNMATMSLFVRTEGNPMALADSVRDRIHAIKPDQPVQNVQNVAELISQSVATRRYTLVLIGT